jgi:hypothetical protein
MMLALRDRPLFMIRLSVRHDPPLWTKRRSRPAAGMIHHDGMVSYDTSIA